MRKFVVYGKKGCGGCVRAEAFLSENHLEFSHVEIGSDITVEGLFEKIGHRVKSIPQIMVIEDGLEIHLGGEVELKEYLAEVEKNADGNTLLEG